MIPVFEIKKEFEKDAGIASNVANFVKAHPVYTAGIVAGIPLSVAAVRAVALPYMAMQQNSQLRTSEAQFRVEYDQTKLLNEIAKSIREKDKVQPTQLKKIEPLA